jgi:hypothetical protein
VPVKRATGWTAVACTAGCAVAKTHTAKNRRATGPDMLNGFRLWSLCLAGMWWRFCRRAPRDERPIYVCPGSSLYLALHRKTSTGHRSKCTRQICIHVSDGGRRLAFTHVRPNRAIHAGAPRVSPCCSCAAPQRASPHIHTSRPLAGAQAFSAPSDTEWPSGDELCTRSSAVPHTSPRVGVTRRPSAQPSSAVLRQMTTTGTNAVSAGRRCWPRRVPGLSVHSVEVAAPCAGH